MLDWTIGKSRIAPIYLLTLALMAALAALRIAYIAICPPPISIDFAPMVMAMGFLAIGAFYTFVRDQAFIATLFNALGLVLIAFLGAMASTTLVFYTGRGFPLVDAQLATLDAAIGFDWLAYLRWFDRRPFLDVVAQVAYESIFAQPFLIILLLALNQQEERVYALITMMVIALLVSSLIALFLPALGPYEFFGVTATDHSHISLITEAKMTAPIKWLRAADFTVPMPDITVGLISFPSYHSATAIIYTWAAWRTPLLKWLSLIVNAGMLLATPIHGSHYVVDVLAGAAIAALTIAATLSAFSRVPHPRPRELALARSSAQLIIQRSRSRLPLDHDRSR